MRKLDYLSNIFLETHEMGRTPQKLESIIFFGNEVKLNGKANESLRKDCLKNNVLCYLSDFLLFD